MTGPRDRWAQAVKVNLEREEATGESPAASGARPMTKVTKETGRHARHGEWTRGHESFSQDPVGRDEHPAVGRVLRQARRHHGLSLREVERRIGRSNAYLSQVERGLIRQPDPSVLLDLAELYGLNFMTLAGWAGWSAGGEDVASGSRHGGAAGILVRRVLELDATEQDEVLDYVEKLRRKRRT